MGQLVSKKPTSPAPRTATDDSARAIATDIATSSRRKMLCGAMGVSAVSVLAACGGGGSDSGDKDGSDKGMAEGNKDDVSQSLAKVSDVPVGGGVAANGVILVQPEEGTITGFDAACPHKGAQLPAPEGDTITCPAHGSVFGAADGSLKSGPAKEGLTEIKVEVKDGEVFRAV
ncbi:MAG TPA: Rieske (2Fe-2S) protein [Candidatus Stackebrandtia faecavium]|nr:Rieske (2Fe-2S) protein [Candidatus Stackebrandtia faecavium]